jgi:hypothetical protein
MAFVMINHKHAPAPENSTLFFEFTLKSILMVIKGYNLSIQGLYELSNLQ